MTDNTIYNAITKITTTKTDDTTYLGRIVIDSAKLQERIDNIVQEALDDTKYDNDITKEVQDIVSSGGNEPSQIPVGGDTIIPPSTTVGDNSNIKVNTDNNEIRTQVKDGSSAVVSDKTIDQPDIEKTEIISGPNFCIPVTISEQKYTTDCHPSLDIKEVANIPSDKIEDPVEEDEEIIDVVIHKTVRECECDKYVLPAPTISVCNDANGNIVVEWSGVPCATVYEVYRDGETNPIAIVSDPTLHYIDDEITDSEVHSYRVRAIRYNRDGSGIDADCTDPASTETSICVESTVLNVGSITGLVDNRIYGDLLTLVDVTGTFTNCVNVVFLREEDSTLRGTLSYYFSSYSDISSNLGDPSLIWENHNIAFDVGYATYTGMVYNDTYTQSIVEDRTIHQMTIDNRPMIFIAENTTTNSSIHLGQSSVIRPSSSSDWGFLYNQFITSEDIYEVNPITLADAPFLDFSNIGVLVTLGNGKLYYMRSTDTGQTWANYDIGVSVPTDGKPISLIHFVYDYDNSIPVFIYQTIEDGIYYAYKGTVPNPSNSGEWTLDATLNTAALMQAYYDVKMSAYEKDNCLEVAECAPCYDMEVITKIVLEEVKYEAIAEINV